MREIIAQAIGIIGLIIIVYSFQCKENKYFFWMQGLGSLVFALNFVMIGAYAGAMFNMGNLLRGFLFAKDDKKLWKLLAVEFAYILAFAFSVYVFWGNWFAIAVAALPWSALVIMSVFMWKGNGAHIRVFQLCAMSPAWLVHNIINFSLGGIICEAFNMVSVIVSFVRFGKEGFSKGSDA